LGQARVTSGQLLYPWTLWPRLGQCNKDYSS